MSAELLHISPLHLIVSGIRTCYLSEGASDSLFDADDKFILGPKDEKLIGHIIKSGHTSTLEHSLISFKINISRACLQEMARHRIGVSPSVQSTRYTLAKMFEDPEVNVDDYLYKSGNDQLDTLNGDQLRILGDIIKNQGVKNDVSKYGIPEALLLVAQWSFNFRSFREFLNLRTFHRAHFEIRELAWDMYNAIPEHYHFLFKSATHEIVQTNTN